MCYRIHFGKPGKVGKSTALPTVSFSVGQTFGLCPSYLAERVAEYAYELWQAALTVVLICERHLEKGISIEFTSASK